MNIKSEIKNLIKDALAELSLSGEIHLEHPDVFSHGDYSTNIAMVLAKAEKKNPKVLAEEIVSKIKESDLLEKVSIAGPGFINFYLSKKFFRKSLLSIDENFGKTKIYEGKRILIEHSSPNLFKPFNIGLMMNNSIGESVARLAEFSGANVVKISYPSDISLGIAKAIWEIKRRGGVEYLNSQKGDLNGEIMKILGECYATATRAFDDSEEVQKEVRDVYKKIVNDESSEEFAIYGLGKELNLSYFQHVAHRLGSRFDAFIFESEAGAVGHKIVKENIGKVFAESDGAVIYEGEKFGLHTRVFINKEGFPTYEAKDIGLLSLKFQNYHPDISIFITDHEQKEYFKVVASAAGHINIGWKDKTIHRTHGRMRFNGEKMSSRLGNTPLVVDVLGTVRDEVMAKMEHKDAVLADTIAVAALKFTILKAEAGKNINFDPETSLSFDGDSGPYIQYTIARSNSLLEKGLSEGFMKSENPTGAWTPDEVEKLLYQFPEIVENSIATWTPHYVANYLLLLARAFNSWYGRTKILDKDNKDAGFYLTLVEKVATTLKNGLYILGIESPEKM
jgi:arginyl-tRNA synthetase